MTFPAKPTTHDLSSLPENQHFPAYDASMAGGNMITRKDPNFAGRGSDSEAVHDVVMATMTDFGNEQSPADLPGPEAVTDKNLTVDVPESDQDGLGMGSPQRTWKGMH